LVSVRERVAATTGSQPQAQEAAAAEEAAVAVAARVAPAARVAAGSHPQA